MTNKYQYTYFKKRYIFDWIFFVLIFFMIGCEKNTPQPDNGVELSKAYEKSITRLSEPVLLTLKVNNSLPAQTRNTYPGYTPDDLEKATINTDVYDNVNSILIDELEGKDYELVSGGDPNQDPNAKVKYISSTANEVVLKLKALPKLNDGQMTIYANVTDNTKKPFIYGSGPESTSSVRKDISNANHIMDYLAVSGNSASSSNTMRIVDQNYVYSTGEHSYHPYLILQEHTSYNIPMSMRYYHVSSSGKGVLYASYSRESMTPVEINTIYLKRAFALLEVIFDNTSYEGQGQMMRWAYRNFKFYNYPSYLSYLSDDYENVMNAQGFQLITRGIATQNTGIMNGDAPKVTATGFDEKNKHPLFHADRVGHPYLHNEKEFKLKLLVPENDPTQDSEQFKLILSIKPGSAGLVYEIIDLPIGARASNGFLKISRNEYYKLRISVFKDALQVGYEVLPFTNVKVDVVPFE